MPPSEYIPKPFHCATCDFVIGESYREPNGRVTYLRVCRRARAPECTADTSGMSALVIYSVTRLSDGAVVCGHCGCENGWYANQSAIEEMLERQHRKREASNET